MKLYRKSDIDLGMMAANLKVYQLNKPGIYTPKFYATSSIPDKHVEHGFSILKIPTSIPG